MDKYKLLRFVFQFFSVLIIVSCFCWWLIKVGVLSLQNEDLSLVLKLNKTELSLRIGDNYQLESLIFPKKSGYEDIIWSSSNNEVLSINKDTGYIKTYKKGTALVKAKLPLSKLESECIINVLDTEILANRVEFDIEELFLAKGESHKLNYNLLPKNSNIHEFDYISSDNKVIVVNDNGVVKAIDAGSAIITIRSKINNISDNVLINVYNNSNTSNYNEEYYGFNNIYSKTSSFDISYNNLELGIGENIKINSTIFPKSANQMTNWISTDESIVSVDSTGVLTGISEGSASVIATTIDGYSQICKVNVSKNYISKYAVDIFEDNINLEIGKIHSLKYSAVLQQLDYSTLNWKSSNKKIAIIDNGTILGIGEGICNIELSTDDGKYKDSIVVNVNSPNNFVKLENISFKNDSYNASVGDTISLIPIFEPMNSNNNFLTWTSSNSNIATVDNGFVKCLDDGEVIITVSNGTINSKVKITITDVKINSISVESDEHLTIPVGISKYLIKKIAPSNATNQEIIWSSSDSSIVNVDKFGLIKTLKKGTAIINLYTIDGMSSKIRIDVI